MKTINTERLKFQKKKATRHSDAVASAQNAQWCRDVLRIRDDSRTEDSREEGPQTTSLREEGELV